MLATHFYEGKIEAGCDEAGRGCLAGSVYAAAVILPDGYQNELLNDSKQLSEKKRYQLREIIERDAVAWAVGIVTPEEIDKINILNASILAMHRALDQLKVRPEAIIVDGNRFKPYFEFTVDGLQFTDDYSAATEGLASKSTVNCKPSTVNCKLLTVNIRMAFLFGFFQALMPLIGWAGISHFQSYMEAYDHWIAFSLLGFIGGRMVWESFHPEEGQHFNPRRLQTQLLLAIATSIDALAVGISFACTGYEQLSQLWMPLAVIGMVSFLFSLLGYWAGYHFGRGIISRFKPELIGGVILILIGVRILMSHLGYI